MVDPIIIDQDTVLGAGKVVGGGGGFVAFVAFVYNLFSKKVEKDIAASREAQGAVNSEQYRINDAVWKKIDLQAQDLTEHKILDAKTYVSRDEFSSFRTHIDDQFDKTRKLIYDFSDKLGRGT